MTPAEHDTADIEELRRRIAAVDLQILGSIKERIDIAEEIGLLKKELGLPITVPSVEEQVVSRYRTFAESEGIDADSMETICRILIEESKRKEGKE